MQSLPKFGSYAVPAGDLNTPGGPSVNLNRASDILHIYYQNVRGLRSKTADFYVSSSSSNYDIINLSETWLKPSIYDSELFNLKYLVLNF